MGAPQPSLPGRPVIELTNQEARQLVLSRFAHRYCESVHQAVQNAGYIQIDTIHVIQRAHHHVLYTRVPGYHPRDLDAALEDRQIFEYWAHAAAYLPMENYRFSLPRMQRIRRRGHEWFQANRRIVEHVLNRITQEGPLMARDFEDPRDKPGQWWDWKPAKIALEELLHQGILMVRERRSFQKVFDLAERILPSHISTTPPNPKEMAGYLIDMTLKNQYISRLPFLSSQHKDGRKHLSQTLTDEVEAGALLPLTIQGEPGWYARPELLDPPDLLDPTCRLDPPELPDPPNLPDLRLPTASPNNQPKNSAPWLCILSPFDNLIIQRAWVEALFDFSYRIECYLPREKRRYGYFSLPLLSHRGFVGMVDLKARRAEKVLAVQAEHLDGEFFSHGDSNAMLTAALEDFARFNGCHTLDRPAPAG